MVGEEGKRQCGLLKFLVLSHALIHGRVYGYGVLKEIVNLSGGSWRPSVGTIYKVISELVSEGLLREERKDVRRGRQVVYYVITREGVEELRRWADWILKRVATGVKFLIMLYSRLAEEGLVSDETIKTFNDVRESLIDFLSSRKC